MVCHGLAGGGNMVADEPVVERVEGENGRWRRRGENDVRATVLDTHEARTSSTQRIDVTITGVSTGGDVVDSTISFTEVNGHT